MQFQIGDKVIIVNNEQYSWNGKVGTVLAYDAHWNWYKVEYGTKQNTCILEDEEMILYTEASKLLYGY